MATARGAPATFTDQFTGTALSSNWVHRMQFYQPESMRNCSKGDPAATRVSGGTLKLIGDPRPRRCRAGSCTAYRQDGSVIGQFDYRLNGHVSTDGHAYLKYGVVAARIKFQPRQGQHASLWMQPQNPTYIPNALEGGAEIDIDRVLRRQGEERRPDQLHLQPEPSGVPQKIGGWIKKPERYLLGEEGRLVQALPRVLRRVVAHGLRLPDRRSRRPPGSPPASPEWPQFPILSLLSSDYELLQLKGEANLPQAMSVDWIRFWQAPGYTPVAVRSGAARARPPSCRAGGRALEPSPPDAKVLTPGRAERFAQVPVR